MMRLRMTMMPPAVFFPYNPSDVISPEERAFALRGGFPLPSLWLSLSRRMLEDNAVCMEANGGAEETLSFAARRRDLSGMKVNRCGRGCFVLTLRGINIYLEGSMEGDLLLFFLDPACRGVRKEEWSLELTGFGSDTAAAFLAAVFGSYEKISQFVAKGAPKTSYQEENGIAWHDR